MFKPNDYDLDKEYRERMMRRALSAQQAKQLTGQTKPAKADNSILVANIISLFWIIVSLAGLVAFFIFLAQPTVI